MMLDPKPLICQQCGAPINRATMRCDYCGTSYKQDNNGVIINYTVERPGIHKIKAKVSVPDELVLRSPEAAKEFSLRKLREQVADGLLGYMKICTEIDPLETRQIIHGEIRVVEPTFTDY